ncbi:MAG: hypothetical protein ACP5RP_04205, partial [Candidatus Micrarchaeia archaeon]
FLLVWLSIMVIFFSYFIISNNSLFILYTFIGFLLLGILLALKNDYITDSTAISIVMISASSIAYMNLLAGYSYIFAIVAIIFAAIISSSLLKASPRCKLYVTLFLAVVASLSFVPSKANFIDINAAIIGYYMLISTAIALLLSNIDAGKRIHKAGLWLKSAIGRTWQSTAAVGVLALIGIVLLALPIWYTGDVFAPLEISKLPYANLTFYNIGASGLYKIKLNASYYIYMLNDKASNIRIYPVNNRSVLKQKPVELYLQNTSTLQEYTTLIARLNSSYKNYRIYFLPTNVNSSNSTYGKVNMLNYTDFGMLEENATYSNYSISNVIYSNISYVDKNMSVILLKDLEKNTTDKFEVPPFYSVQSLCPEGEGTANETISFKSNNSISVFFFSSQQNFTISTGEAAGNQNYTSILHIFLEHSYASRLNFTNTSFGFKILGDGSCMMYIIATQNYSAVRLSQTLKYEQPYSITHTYKIPKTVLPRSKIASFDFLPEGLSYLYKTYMNATNSSS